MTELNFTDSDGDTARFEFDPFDVAGACFVEADNSGVYLSDDDVRALRAAIDEHLGDRKPVTAAKAEAAPKFKVGDRVTKGGKLATVVKLAPQGPGFFELMVDGHPYPRGCASTLGAGTFHEDALTLVEADPGLKAEEVAVALEIAAKTIREAIA